MLLFILHTLFVLTSGQVANQSPIVDGLISTDWTQGSVLLNSDTFQWYALHYDFFLLTKFFFEN